MASKVFQNLDSLTAPTLATVLDMRRLEMSVLVDSKKGLLFCNNDPRITPELSDRIQASAAEIIAHVVSGTIEQAKATTGVDSLDRMIRKEIRREIRRRVRRGTWIQFQV